jgi:hypothetical protein
MTYFEKLPDWQMARPEGHVTAHFSGDVTPEDPVLRDAITKALER